MSRIAEALADRYRIERELGAGGMATVYLAHDLRHDRKVAIKVLRPELAAVIGAERFLKEIKTTANLQHPHILGLIDSGEADTLLWYAMPFVEGESLRDRLQRDKQLPITDAVRIATEVAGALDYAHRHGVIHRDIKPENILLHDGSALVADFGIALAASTAGTRMTETGMSLGTPHYMSPEQAMGEREITARSDVYALGCVTYEMLIGDPPFTGSTAQAIVAKVVTERPRSLIAQRHTIRPQLEAAVLTALEKLPADRFATAAEFAGALADRGYASTAFTHALAAESELQRKRMPVVILSMAVVVFAVVALLGWLRPHGPATVATWAVLVDPNELVSATVGGPAISPDGSIIAYSGAGAELRLRKRNDLRSAAVPGATTAWSAFFSPDGKEIAFATAFPGPLKVLSLATGAIVGTVTDSAFGYGGSWSTEGWIYYVGASHGGTALMRAHPDGGASQLIARPDTSKGELFFYSPTALPGGKTVLVTIWRRNGNADIAAVDVTTGVRTVITPGAQATYAPGFVFIQTSDSKLNVAPYSPANPTHIGTATTLVDNVQVVTQAGNAISVSDEGTLVYQQLNQAPATIVRVARTGEVRPVQPGWSGSFSHLALSPDGKHLAVSVVGRGASELWIKTMDNGPFTLLASGGTINYHAWWTPDGAELLFASDRTGETQLYHANLGTGSTALLQQNPRGIEEGLMSGDGQWLVMRIGSGGARDIMGRRTHGDTAIVPLVASSFDEFAPALSADGQCLAYASDESRRVEVYVRPFPHTAAARNQVSQSGGSEPMWSHKGRELYFRSDSGDLVAVQIAAGPECRVMSQRILFPATAYASDNRARAYAVSPDDQSFLFIRPETPIGNQLIVLYDWRAALKAKGGH